MPLPEQPVEIEFRDGVRSVPAHLRYLIAISELDTTRYTFEEAVRLSNDAVLKMRLNNAVQTIISDHFRSNF